jgi:phosphoenolpyruvate carboxykinase (GTP)
MADYFGHWLKMGRSLARPPAIFHVNWFKTGSDGKFLWPGFGQNLRVLLWMVDRIQGKGGAVETPVGLVPKADALNMEGLELGKATLEALLHVERDEWAEEVPEIRAFFERFGDRLPAAMNQALDGLAQRLGVVASA